MAVLGAIRGNLELTQVTMSEFVELVKTHLGGKWDNPAGFLRYLSKSFRVNTRSASDPLTAAAAEEKNYCCAFCGSRVRGKGALLVDGKFVPCSCASEEYISHERARGVFAEDLPR
jgi:hypothetical protein